MRRRGAESRGHLEQRHILRQELGHVDVHERPQQQHALHLLGVLELQVARRRQHRLDRPHAVVVVVLGGELFRAQSVGGHNLLGQTVVAGGAVAVIIVNNVKGLN